MDLTSFIGNRRILSGFVTGLLTFVAMAAIIDFMLYRISIYDRWAVSGNIGDHPYPFILMFVISPLTSASLGLGIVRRWKILIWVSCLVALGVVALVFYYLLRAHSIYVRAEM